MFILCPSEALLYFILTNYLWNFRVSKFCEAQWRLFLFMLVHNFMLFEFELHIGRYTCIQNPHNSNQLSKKDLKKILYGMFYSEILFFRPETLPSGMSNQIVNAIPTFIGFWREMVNLLLGVKKSPKSLKTKKAALTKSGK